MVEAASSTQLVFQWRLQTATVRRLNASAAGSSGMLRVDAFIFPDAVLRFPERFDHSDFLYELKHDRFRALAGGCAGWQD